MLSEKLAFNRVLVTSCIFAFACGKRKPAILKANEVRLGVGVTDSYLEHMGKFSEFDERWVLKPPGSGQRGPPHSDLPQVGRFWATLGRCPIFVQPGSGKRTLLTLLQMDQQTIFVLMTTAKGQIAEPSRLTSFSRKAAYWQPI